MAKPKKKGDTFDGGLSNYGRAVLKQEDKVKRAGDAKTNNTNRMMFEKREKLKNPETKNQLLDYIFGKSEENPLEDIKKNYEPKLTKIPTINKSKEITLPEDVQTEDSQQNIQE